MLPATTRRGHGSVPLVYHAGLFHGFAGGALPMVLIWMSGVMLGVFATVSPTEDLECNQTFIQSTGAISSPGYPDSYPASSDCTYIIQRPREGPTSLQFTVFDLEEDDKCAYDYVEIWEGHTEVLVGGPYCGVKTNLVVNMPSNFTIVKFHTDSSSSAAGFSLVYYGSSTCENASGVCVSIGLPCSEEMSFSCVDPTKKCCTSGNGVFATVSPTEDLECNQAFNQSTGAISSPGYPDSYPASLDCTYIIQRPREGPTSLQFTAFVLEEDDKCTYDYVEIWEGHDEVLVGGPYCGVKTNLMVDVPSDFTIIKFHTDSSSSAAGFSLVYYDPFTCEDVGGVCVTIGLPCSGEMSYTCGDLSKRCCTSGNEDRVIDYIEDSGVVLSPSYPSDYPNSYSCMYIIRRPTSGPTALHALDFALENNAECMYDSLEVFDGPDGSFPSLGRFCGNSMDKMNTSGNTVALLFLTDSSEIRRGFKIQYKPFEDCGIHYGYCHHQCAPSLTYFARCPPGQDVCCRDGSDFECIDQFVAEQGLVESPHFPAALLYNLNCVFVITNPHGRVALAFLTFDLGDDDSGCTTEYVQIYDGRSLIWPTLGPPLCGTRSSHVISTGSSIAIELRTDAVGSNRGFQAVWEAPTCSFWGGYCGTNCTNNNGTYEYDDCEDGQRCCLDDCDSIHMKTCPDGTCIKDFINCVCPEDYFVCPDFTCVLLPENCGCPEDYFVCPDFTCSLLPENCSCPEDYFVCPDFTCSLLPENCASHGLNAGEAIAIAFGLLFILFIAAFAYWWMKIRRRKPDQESPSPQLEETTLSPSPGSGAGNSVFVDDNEEDERTLEEQYGHYATPPPTYEEGCSRPRVVRSSRARDKSSADDNPPPYDTVC